MIFNDKMWNAIGKDGKNIPKPNEIVIVKGVVKDEVVFADEIYLQRKNSIYTKLSDLKDKQLKDLTNEKRYRIIKNMSLQFYKPNSKSTGTACSFWRNAEDNTFWVSLIYRTLGTPRLKLVRFLKIKTTPRKEQSLSLAT